MTVQEFIDIPLTQLLFNPWAANGWNLTAWIIWAFIIMWVIGLIMHLTQGKD
jgi:hypothetical protein